MTTTRTGTAADVVVPQPIADLEGDGLLARFPEGMRLVGTRCSACGLVMLGARVVCSSCIGTEVERLALPSTGVLYSFTRIHVGAAGVRPLGYVDLDDDVRTLADLREEGVALEPGMRVELGVDGDDWFFARPNDSNSTTGSTGSTGT